MMKICLISSTRIKKDRDAFHDTSVSLTAALLGTAVFHYVVLIYPRTYSQSGSQHSAKIGDTENPALSSAALYRPPPESPSKYSMAPSKPHKFLPHFSIMPPSFPTDIHLLSYGTYYRTLLYIATYFLRSFGRSIFSFTLSGTSISPNR